MFTIEKIQEIHSKIKNRVDFKRYIREFSRVGIKSCSNYTEDGRAIYVGENGFSIGSEAIHEHLEVAPKVDIIKLEQAVISHQHGELDYTSFCQKIAEAGVKKWILDADKRVCTYYDKFEEPLLDEPIV